MGWRAELVAGVTNVCYCPCYRHLTNSLFFGFDAVFLFGWRDYWSENISLAKLVSVSSLSYAISQYLKYCSVAGARELTQSYVPLSIRWKPEQTTLVWLLHGSSPLVGGAGQEERVDYFLWGFHLCKTTHVIIRQRGESDVKISLLSVVAHQQQIEQSREDPHAQEESSGRDVWCLLAWVVELLFLGCPEMGELALVGRLCWILLSGVCAWAILFVFWHQDKLREIFLVSSAEINTFSSGIKYSVQTRQGKNLYTR